MAPLKNAIFAAFALAALTSAVPLALDRRAVVTNTVTETTWTTVDVTKTVYAGEQATQEAKAETPTPAPAAATTSAPEPPAQSEQPVEQPAAAANFAEQPQSQAAAPVVPSTASSSAPAPPAATSQASSSPSSSSGTTYTGDFTHYDGGLGACGWNVDTNSEDAIALPHGMMGAQSNGNPYCGKTVIITSPETGEEFSAKVSDKCMGCDGASIDATNSLFKKVAPNGDGRVGGVNWRFQE